jgi:hypothetical protein
MKHIRPISLIILLAAAAFAAPAQDAAKTEETVIAALKAGDGGPVGDCLNELCDLDLPGFRGTYSKAQAGKIIADLFSGKSFTGFRLLRQGQLADKEKYTLGEMKSGTQTWRVYFVVKDKNGKGVVPIFRVYQ